MFLGTKRRRHDANDSSPSSIEIKEARAVHFFSICFIYATIYSAEGGEDFYIFRRCLMLIYESLWELPTDITPGKGGQGNVVAVSSVKAYSGIKIITPLILSL
jgi:hypothetical protein